MNTCARDGCDNTVIQRGGRGRPARYCSPQCRQRVVRPVVRAEPRPAVAGEQHCARDGCGNAVVQHGKGRPAVYCSRKCKDAVRHLDERAAKVAVLGERICAVCPNVIPASVTLKAKCCSRECSTIYQNRKRAEEKIAARRADPRTCQARDCTSEIPAESRQFTYCSTACKRREHSARWREQSPDYMRGYLYGISPGEYAAMLAAQGGVCAICGTDEWGGKDNRPHTDHCHETGRFRGILCGNCNNGLGMFGEDPARLRAAADYLELANALQLTVT